MKKTLIVAAVTASFATAASAQSSVTLYGLVDAGFTYVNNELSMASSQANLGSRFSVNGGNMQQSFWGMRGRESLGGGTSAVFTLENGFDVANGQSTNGRAFGRQAFVGLSNNQYGTLTLGRQNNLVADYLGPLTATGSFGGTYFAHPFNNDQANADQAAHLNNSVKYQSANYAGLTFGGEYGFSNAAGAFAANRAYSFGAGYANGPFKVAAAYLQTQATNSRNANGAIQDPALSVTLNGGTQQQLSLTSESNRTYGVGGSYDIGAATIGLDWTQSRLQFGYLDSSLRFNNYEINGKYALTPALLIGAAYTYTESKLGAPGERNERHGRWHQFGLTSDYSLSKRTDIYAAAVYQKSNNETASEISGTNAPSASTNQVVVTTGIRHRF